MTSLQLFLGGLLAVGLGAMLVMRTLQKKQRLEQMPEHLFGHLRPLFASHHIRKGESNGTWVMEGRYRDEVFQLKAVIDTLAVRKLPSLWLLVTLPSPQPVPATFDMMMRPASHTSFSNFDLLPHGLQLPAGFPDEAVIRSDLQSEFPSAAVSPHLDLFRTRHGKELLISPKGLRIVVQLAEADRARYVVMREANFFDAEIDPTLAKKCMDTLINLQRDIRNYDA